MAVNRAKQSSPLLDLVGNTPLIEVPVFQKEFPRSSVYAKLESMNPGGSIKDRSVSRMLRDAQADGLLHDNKIVLDSSSGNAGIAYAMFASALGHKVKIVIPDNASAERRQRLEAHGAEIILTDGVLGYDEALLEVRRMYEGNPDIYFFADQYSNESNWLAHYETTAQEILSQAPKTFSYFVSGIGTGGTITGVGRRLREERPDVQIVAAIPPEFPGVEGLKPLGADHINPAIFDRSVVDKWIEIDIDASRSISFALARIGIFSGQSSGAYMYVVRQILEQDPEAHVVTVFPDAGDRYFSVGLWEP
ncbi:MAG: cysteine synthase [Chloroflexi bacterium]|nr:cysteine synthase [Chloroflexota bacterium]|tara:strand:- start:17983 stop:18900 length:918 start_codon:yes stop_codon:yes gene_type:complete